MSNTTKFILGIIGAVLVIGLAFQFGSKNSVNLGADVMTNPQWFYNGSSFGKGNWFVGGNAGDSSFGISASQTGSSPVFSISSAGVVSIPAFSSSGAASILTFTEGGSVNSTSTVSTTVAIPASYFDTENVIDVMVNGASATLSFPATSTLTSFIPTAGQTRTIYIRNATTTAATTLTITGGTGVLLKQNATTTALLGGGTSHAKIDFVRKSNGDIAALLSIFN